MRFGSFLELIITLFVFLVIWILPRIIAARAADRKRKAGKAKSSPKSAPNPERSWSKEIFSTLFDDTALDQKDKPLPAEVPEDVPAGVAAQNNSQQEESVSVFTGEEAPPQEPSPQHGVSGTAVLPGPRRTPLQKAVIWKELLDSPKALRPDPFP
ncbi:hypothetical protein [Marispirochaeta sp.]|uniref:hypothetical protein n=1 Tax=Marispirochaeta sp. TaxID=2038653 RepID=UPI0029C8EC1D|nr:hypothetical protein [Marispirochaeta sp.]